MATEICPKIATSFLHGAIQGVGLRRLDNTNSWTVRAVGLPINSKNVNVKNGADNEVE